MKIELIKQKFDGIEKYKYKPFSWCCNNIKENPCISFDNDLYENEDDYEEDYLPGFAIFHTIPYGDWDSDYIWEQSVYYKINHCPFCGEPIEIVVVAEEDIDELYRSLSKQHDELWKKYNRTDSKKKAAELEKQIKELNDKIDWLYRLAEYKSLE